ncbi:MAG: site-specific integrase [Burkholderiaceae bacterium]
MAGKKRFPNGTWQYTFKRAGVLDKPLYMTFDSETEGDAYAERLEALLDRGIVPSEAQAGGKVLTIAQLDREYQRDAHPSAKDRSALGVIVGSHGGVRLTSLDAAWVDTWISGMKRIEKLAPASIRARVGALARCTDWGMRKRYLKMPDHPLRTLPDGYAQYTEADIAFTGQARTDVERDRRLEPGEDERIFALIASGQIPRKHRPWVLDDVAAIRCMYLLAQESAMRLREMYTLGRSQIDLAHKTVFLDKTKNGDKRQVPLSSVALATLTEYLEGVEGEYVFPWWNGDSSEANLKNTSDFLSNLYKEIFEAAGCKGLRFHDLRHEATSRLFERTKMSETKIMKITGHKSRRMLMRYANLRGSDLSAEMW